MEITCDECGSKNMEIDTAKGEAVCECGLVHDLPDNTADTNSSTSYGDGQQHSTGIPNTGDNGLGSVIDLNPTQGLQWKAFDPQSATCWSHQLTLPAQHTA